MLAPSADQPVEVGRDRLTVGGVVDREITHAMTGRLQPTGEIAHGDEDRQDLLRVVEDVIRLLADFHQHVEHVRIAGRKPGMSGVELVAQQQAQHGHSA
jgi:hypothetical protein